jgi:hypothetical protein
VRDIREVLGGEVEKVFSEGGRKALIVILEEQVAAEIQNRKMQALVEFSTNDRGRRQSEWSELEIADSD